MTTSTTSSTTKLVPLQPTKVFSVTALSPKSGAMIMHHVLDDNQIYRSLQSKALLKKVDVGSKRVPDDTGRS